MHGQVRARQNVEGQDVESQEQHERSVEVIVDGVFEANVERLQRMDVDGQTGEEDANEKKELKEDRQQLVRWLMLMIHI